MCPQSRRLFERQQGDTDLDDVDRRAVSCGLLEDLHANSSLCLHTDGKGHIKGAKLWSPGRRGRERVCQDRANVVDDSELDGRLKDPRPTPRSGAPRSRAAPGPAGARSWRGPPDWADRGFRGHALGAASNGTGRSSASRVTRKSPVPCWIAIGVRSPAGRSRESTRHPSAVSEAPDDVDKPSRTKDGGGGGRRAVPAD